MIELRQKNYPEALSAAKSALGCIESKLMDQMNRTPLVQLKTNAVFVENLLVLLVAYFNYGMCQLKMGSQASSDAARTPIKARKSLEDANQSFQHGSKIANRYLGHHHYFSQKLIRKVQACQTLIQQSRLQTNNGMLIMSQYGQSTSSNAAGFVAKKKSIMRQHQEYLMQSSQKHGAN